MCFAGAMVLPLVVMMMPATAAGEDPEVAADESDSQSEERLCQYCHSHQREEGLECDTCDKDACEECWESFILCAHCGRGHCADCPKFENHFGTFCQRCWIDQGYAVLCDCETYCGGGKLAVGHITCVDCEKQPCEICFEHFNSCVECQRPLCWECPQYDDDYDEPHCQECFRNIVPAREQIVPEFPPLTDWELEEFQETARKRRDSLTKAPKENEARPDEHHCQLTGVQMVHPFLTVCGCSLEKSIIDLYEGICCPHCLSQFRSEGEPVPGAPNRHLKNLIDEWKAPK